MRYWLKVFGLVLLAAVLMGIAFIAGTVLQPRPILKAWISMTERNVARKQILLGQMLRQGMSPEEVKAILGDPGKAEDVENGIRWFYYRGGVGGERIVVEFRYRHHGSAVFKGEARICYANNGTEAVSIYPDTDPEYFTIGKPLKKATE